MNPGLKPCPFCGCRSPVMHIGNSLNNWIVCAQCGARMVLTVPIHPSKPDLISEALTEGWNSRSSVTGSARTDIAWVERSIGDRGHEFLWRFSVPDGPARTAMIGLTGRAVSAEVLPDGSVRLLASDVPADDDDEGEAKG